MFILFHVVEGNAQTSVHIPAVDKAIPSIQSNSLSVMSDPFGLYPTTPSTFRFSDTRFKKYPSINHLPGMFCKLEYKMETKSKLAPRFRLGSLAYTEWMEGKTGFYQAQHP